MAVICFGCGEPVSFENWDHVCSSKKEAPSVAASQPLQRNNVDGDKEKRVLANTYAARLQHNKKS